MNKFRHLALSVFSLLAVFSTRAQTSSVREADSIFVKAMELYVVDNYPEAGKLLLKAEELAPDNDAVQYYLGNIAIKANDAEGAVEHLEKARMLDSTNVWYNTRLAALYSALELNVKAGKLYDYLLKARPYDSNLLASATDCYLQNGEYAKADSCLVMIRRLNGDSEYTSLMGLELLRQKGDFTKFFASMDEYFRVGDAPASSKMDMIDNMLRSGNPLFIYAHIDDYEKLIDTCLEIHPSDTVITHYAARFFYSLEKTGKALELCQRHTDDVLMNQIRAHVYYQKLNDYEKTLNACEDILRTVPDTDKESIVEAMSLKAECLLNLGRNSEAFREYENCLKADPDNIIVLNNYAYILSTSGKSLGKALKMAEKAIRAEPENSTYLDTYGWVLYKKGKFKEAKAVFKKAVLHGGSESGVILNHYAETLEALGEKETAEIYRQKALLKKDLPE